jgi:two-component system NtrC family sensor kinase
MGNAVILLVDDSEDIRRFLAESILSPEGYSVRTAGDGQAGLDLAREIQPDLLITDHQMPRLTGIELISRLREEMPLVPVILITGEGSEAVAAKALRAGAVNYLIKPFAAEVLLEAIELALEEGRRRAAWLDMRAQARANSQDLQRRAQELAALSEIGRSIRAGMDLDGMLKMIVDAAVGLTNADEGSLLLLDEESGDLFMRASRNFDQEFAESFRIRSNDSLAGQVIERGEAVVLDESSPQKIKTSYLVHSLIYVPLILRERTVGVLGVDNREAGRPLTPEHVEVMKAMADYAAMALESARLYQASETQRRKYESILANTRNGVIVVDEAERVQMINHAASEIVGVDESALGLPASQVFEDPRILALMQQSDEDPRWEEIELDGGRVFNAQRARIEGIGQAIVLHEISHLKEVDRVKSEFVTSVSHDLRSPLAAILGYVELVEQSGKLNEQQTEFVRRVYISIDHITNLITDLLDLGRIEAGLDASKEPAQIPVLAKYAADSIRSFADSRAVNLEESLSENVPVVKGDPLRLRQMIGNLLENAIKYTPQGGKVSIDCMAEDEQIILRVRDTGIGIPSGEQAMLFTRFYRGSNVPDGIVGTGLGLSIVKSIVDNHNGRIWVESKVGEGTEVTVVLPMAKV